MANWSNVFRGMHTKSLKCSVDVHTVNAVVEFLISTWAELTSGIGLYL